MSGLKLIKEEITPGFKTLNEASGMGRQYYIEGIFMQAEVPNGNGRIYPAEILDPAVEKYITEFVDDHRGYGELGHPSSPTVNLDRVSHIVTKLKKSGNNWIGRAKVLDTPNGRIVKSLIDEGCKLGVSSRALGDFKKDSRGIDIITDLIIFAAADVVHDPSAPDAFVRGIMEGKEWVFDGVAAREMFCENAKKRLKKATVNNYKQMSQELFEDFLKQLAREY